MKSINSAVEEVLHSNVNKSRTSISFEQVWDKYTKQKSGVNRRWNKKNMVVAASVIFALMLFIAYQTPVMAYVEHFLK